MKGIHFCFIVAVLIFGSTACNPPGSNKLLKINEPAVADSIGIKFKMVTNVIEMPVELNVSPDNSHRLFVTDNRGKIWVLKNDSILTKPFFNIYDKVGKQAPESELGNIFSVAFHPQFSTNKKFYVCYNAPSTLGTKLCKLVVAAFNANKNSPDLADLNTEQRVFEMEGKNIKNNGAQIAFGPDGYLYISIGDDNINDSAYRYHAQDLNFLNGKLLRIDVNKTPYAIPPDNPFVGVKHARPEIWAFGFRKLWRFSFNTVTHQLFGADVGENMEEEIDIVKKGANYGWPVKEGDSSFKKGDADNKMVFTAPINTYTHKEGICVIGGSVYYGKEIPTLKNKYVFADFNGKMFVLFKDASENWVRQPLKILNKPADPFFICGCNVGENNELFVMGLLNTKTGSKGAVYKIVKI